MVSHGTMLPENRVTSCHTVCCHDGTLCPGCLLTCRRQIQQSRYIWQAKFKDATTMSRCKLSTFACTLGSSYNTMGSQSLGQHFTHVQCCTPAQAPQKQQIGAMMWETSHLSKLQIANCKLHRTTPNASTAKRELHRWFGNDKLENSCKNKHQNHAGALASPHATATA
jgi:hypothetical protein